jgi:lipopolysaccharide transport system ATP-binding protein
MSSNIAIRVDHLSKIYRLYNSPADRVRETFSPFRRTYHHPFHALRDVSLEIQKGETVGIIGQNGSGKSTLLQLVCGILQPSSGTVVVNGRVSALLELGAGFNLEFTGRQNVYLNGSILGLTKEEVDSHLDDILAFADIGEFIDQPVKSYSSGMYVRLAFAVAISIKPDILVVDEALSVGDEAFQRKCFAQINGIQEAGGTILFVSHAASSIIELCSRAILLDQGEMLLAGLPKPVVSRYQKMLYASPDHIEHLKRNWQEKADRFQLEDIDGKEQKEEEQAGSAEKDETSPQNVYDPGLVPAGTVSYERKGAEIREPFLADSDGKAVNVLRCGREYFYCYTVFFEEPAHSVKFGMLIKTVKGVELSGCSAPLSDTGTEAVAAGSRWRIRFPFRCDLNPGVYFLNAGVLGRCNGEEIFLDRKLDVAMFRVEEKRNPSSSALVDMVGFPRITHLEDDK